MKLSHAKDFSGGDKSDEAMARMMNVCVAGGGDAGGDRHSLVILLLLLLLLLLPLL